MRMKIALFALVAAILLALPSHAQTATVHQNTLSCSAPSPDSTTANPGTTILYRSVGASNSTFVKYQTGLPPTCNYVDTAVAPGQVTNYYFTALIGGVESGPTNKLSLTTPTFPPGSATGTSQ